MILPLWQNQHDDVTEKWCGSVILNAEKELYKLSAVLEFG
jgi:hypothetical protein